jgi:hypothetical protein
LFLCLLRYKTLLTLLKFLWYIRDFVKNLYNQSPSLFWNPVKNNIRKQTKGEISIEKPQETVTGIRTEKNDSSGVYAQKRAVWGSATSSGPTSSELHLF